MIEINLSPACSERVPWLTKMLNDMAFDLVSWLERKILLNSGQENAYNFNEVLYKKRINFIKTRDKYEFLNTLNTEEFYIENNI